jgi:hypothetical protein
MNPPLAELPTTAWPDEAKDWFRERMAIKMYDAGMSEAEAREAARADVIRTWRERDAQT